MDATRRLSEAMQQAALAVSTAEGEQVFDQLVEALARILGVGYALISVYVEPGRTHLRTLATVFGGKRAKNVEYPVAGTPCEQAIGRTFGYYPKGVARLFPGDGILAERNLEGYAATTLHDVHGAPIGALAVMSDRELDDPVLTEAMLKIFAARVSAEIERQRSEASYRAIFEAAETAVLLHDFESGAIVDANPKACATYGYSVEELRRLSMDDLSSGVPPYTGAKAEMFIARARSGEVVRGEWQWRHRDGSLHWDEVTLKKVEIAGRPFVLEAAREITERKAAEEALRASEEQYRAIFDAASDSLNLRDAAFRVVDANPAYERMSGFSLEEVAGRETATVLSLRDPAYARELHGRALAGEIVRIEGKAARKDGTLYDIEVHGVPMTYRGEPHVLYVGRDITGRKAADAALRASEEQYRAIFNATADSLVLRDADFRIVDVNAAYEAMSGRSRAEALGRGDVTMSDPAMAAHIRALHARALAGEHVQWEARAARKNGATFDIEVRGVPIRHQGRPHVLYIGRDIGARREAEEQRLALERQLRQAQKMEAIGQLSGGIAHDFNNILQSILGNLVLAAERAEESGDARLAKYLDRARRSAQRARDLIRQMLTFSRGQRAERRAVSLPALVHEAMNLLRSPLPSTIELRTRLAEGLPQVQLDPVQIEQVLLNLCINARDAMGGAGAIEVGARVVEHLAGACASCRQQVAGRHVELSVRDSGPGISPLVMDRMFEPFYSTKEIGKGSGMGLAMAHGIVHEHGGHILVDSSLAGGATFRLLFPAAAPAAAPVAAAARGAARAKKRLAGRVLVVDDEEMIREFLAELLGGWGLEVAVHADGVAARDAFASDPHAWDLVITDQTMPRLTGLQLARTVSRIRPGVPIVLCTGYAEDLAQPELDAAGVHTLARKPVEPDQLRTLLERHLGRR